MAKTTITIEGANALDLAVKEKAVITLASLPTEEVEKLGLLANSPTARKKFMSNWNMIKRLTGI